MTKNKERKKMKQLNKLQTIVFLAGSVLMVAGVVLNMIGTLNDLPALRSSGAVVFAAGAVAFATMQLQQTYSGRNFTIRRLRRIMSVGDVFFILSAVLMLEDVFHFILPLFLPYVIDGYNNYVTYVQNNWVVLLLAAAMIEVYTTHRISSELKKEQDASGQRGA